MKKRQGLVFQVILVAAIAVRLLGFGTVLVGINQDEAHKRKRRKAEDHSLGESNRLPLFTASFPYFPRILSNAASSFCCFSDMGAL